MKFDNEQITGKLRLVDKTELMQLVEGQRRFQVLQYQFKCWNAVTPSDIRYIWRDVPVVSIMDLGND